MFTTEKVPLRLEKESRKYETQRAVKERQGGRKNLTVKSTGNPDSFSSTKIAARESIFLWRFLNPFYLA